MARGHLILLPRADYYKWVRAAQQYALHFGVGITPDPAKAADQQVVTVVAPPGGYPNEGDIHQWIKKRYPQLLVDLVYVDTQEKLRQVLEERIRAGRAYQESREVKSGEEQVARFPQDRLYLFWPTDYGEVLQPFGANPELYSQYGLPGHEGLDIRAPHGANVYACAEGEVYLVEDGRLGHNYGCQVRIRHAGGYKTIYAHLERALVQVGEQVKARQLIGRADSSGNSSGNHLHLTLKKTGVTDGGESDYPLDIIDPTPFLVYPQMEDEVMAVMGITRPERSVRYPWTRDNLAGINLRVGGSMQESDFSTLERAGFDAVKVYAHTSESVLRRLRAINPDMFIMARMARQFDGQVLSGRAWAQLMMPDLSRLIDQGVQYFELHQSPNLQQNGWRLVWDSGEGFGEWWLAVVEDIKGRFPQARVGFPGVSPGGQIPGQRLDAEVFLEGADRAMAQADWLGVNCYWHSEGEMHAIEKGRYYVRTRERYPDKLLFITEFGNTNPLTNPEVKGREYLKYLETVRETPGVGAAFAMVLSAARGYQGMTWRSESGKISPIVDVFTRKNVQSRGNLDRPAHLEV
jgi:murein DD-endopeptidase MepM/ murein hydrolase activator NlpD